MLVGFLPLVFLVNFLDCYKFVFSGFPSPLCLKYAPLRQGAPAHPQSAAASTAPGPPVLLDRLWLLYEPQCVHLFSCAGLPALSAPGSIPYHLLRTVLLSDRLCAVQHDTLPLFCRMSTSGSLVFFCHNPRLVLIGWDKGW